MVATVEFEPQDHVYLDTKVKTKWLKALRSRKFKQGYHFLKNHSNKYCCLGVLAELEGVHIEVESTSFIDEADAAALFHCDKTQACDLQRTLANKNDGYDGGSSYNIKPQKFYQIARWIERNL